MRTPSSIKTENSPAYISRQFKQLLHSFSIKQITDVSYNPQTQDIVKQTHHTVKLQIKIKRKVYTGTLLSSLSRADFTRFQCNIFFEPITIVNIALFVLIFLNLPRGDILTKAEKHFEALKVTSFPLPIWYQDGLTNQWTSRKLILQGRGMLVFLQMDPTNSHGFLFRRFNLMGPPTFKLEMKQQKPQEEEIPVQVTAALKISKKCRTRCLRPYDLPTWREVKTLTNQAENLISQQGMLQNHKNIFVRMLAFLAFASPAQTDLIDHTYWAYVPNPPFYCRL